MSTQKSQKTMSSLNYHVNLDQHVSLYYLSNIAIYFNFPPKGSCQPRTCYSLKYHVNLDYHVNLQKSCPKRLCQSRTSCRLYQPVNLGLITMSSHVIVSEDFTLLSTQSVDEHVSLLYHVSLQDHVRVQDHVSLQDPVSLCIYIFLYMFRGHEVGW